MKKSLSVAVLLLAVHAQAQIGIGTTTPNSMLDVRGAISLAVTTFTTATTAGASDNTFLFTGTSAATLTLPTAVGITGRVYWVKNISSNGSTLTIATTSSQTIDGLTTWTLTQTNKAMRLLSNGANWYIVAESLPGNSTGTAWLNGGNSVASMQNIGTTSNFHLPFITNNTEKMRLTSTGSLGIGTTTFNGTYPERLIVDAGATGNTNYQNVIVGKGNTNSYSQINIQNGNAGLSASSDVIATADNGSESVNYVDVGINSSVNTQNYFGGLNDAYLYAIGDGVNTGGNLYIGTATASRDIAFLSGGGTKSSGATMNNERMRILGTGNVGININTPNSTLDVRGALSLNLRVFTGTTTPISSTDNTVIFTGTLASTATLPDAIACPGRMYRIKNASITSPTPLLTIATTSAQTIDGLASWVLDEGYGSVTITSNGANWLITSQSVPKSSGGAWVQGGNSVSAIKNLGTMSNYDLPFITNNTEKMRLTAGGNLGIGTNSPASDLTLYQSSGFTTSKGFRFTGNSIAGTNTGSGFAMALGYNTVNNKQLWMGDADYLGNAAATFLRIESGTGLTTLNAIAGDNSVRRPIRIGIGGDPNSAVIFGADGSSTTPSSYVWANGNMAIGSSYISTAAPTDGLIVQGNTGIGASTFNATYPERLIVDAGTPAVAGRYQNVIVGKGNTNSYAQLNIQNINAGLNASSDVVATADNGSETTNYVDMGINSSVNTSGVMGTANDAYLYNIGRHFFIGTGTSAKSLIFLTGGTDSATNERMRIDGNGNVGIGKPGSTAAKLDVSGVISADSSIFVDAAGINTGTKIGGLFFGGAGSGEVIASKRTAGTNQFGLDFYTNSNLRMSVILNGNVGIGTNTPASKLTVAGVVAPSADNTYSLGAGTGNRWTAVYATNGTIQTSDRRLKTNIKNLNYGLKEILALQPVRYNWKDSTHKENKIGLIAQEVKKIVPEVVTGDESKEKLGMNYAELVPVLINAIKEQQKQIDDLKKKVAALERK